MAERSPTKRQARAAATQDQLLGAAREVFEAKGYHATTVGAITASADTAHGTFYLYFKNKEDAFAKVMEQVTGELFEQAGGRWDVGDPYTSIEASMRAFLEVFTAHRGLWRCALEASFTSPSIEAMWLGIRQSFVDRVERHLRHLDDAGLLRPLDPVLTANALGSMVEWTATTRFVLATPAEPGAVEDAVRNLTDLWYHAIFPDSAGGEPPRA